MLSLMDSTRRRVSVMSSEDYYYYITTVLQRKGQTMKLNFELNNDEINCILSSCGYVKESVTAYYRKSILIMEDDEQSDLQPFCIDVAYREGRRPSELSSDTPMLENLESYRLPNVVDALVKQRFLMYLFDTVS